MQRLTGTSVPRVEDERLLTGRACYLDDHQPVGVLHAVFVRSPVAHGALVDIEVSLARSAPGVVAVLTAEELSDVLPPLRPVQVPGLGAPVHPALAAGVVRYVGDPIAVVVAETRTQAVDAAECIEVAIERWPAVVDRDAARQADSPLVWPELGTNVLHRSHHLVGDVDGGFAAAHTVVRQRFDQHRVTMAPMECRGMIATYDPASRTLDVIAAHQSPHDLRLKLAAALSIPANRVRVRCADIGGSFGQKSGLSREEAVVAAATVITGRPVKWVETRSENLQAAGQAREEHVEVEAAFDAHGALLAVRLHLVLDHGAYPQIGYPANGYANLIRTLFPAAYRLGAYEFTGELVATNKASYVPYRGPWEVETWARERMFDHAARQLGIDRLELRRRNLLDDEELERGSCLGVDLRGVRVRATLERAVETIAPWHDEVAIARASGRHVGIGVSCYVEPAPVPPSLLVAMGFTAAPRTAQEARARLEPDGTLTVFTSQQPHGQSHETTLAQLAADAVGLGLDQVRVVYGDTEVVPFNLVGTGGSRAATLASGAVLGAADLVRSRLLDLAGDLLEIAPADLEIVDGAVRAIGVPTAAMPITALAAHAYARPGSASPDGTAGIDVRSVFLSDDGTWSQATHCCLVEVDVETGATKILRYLVVEDCGPPIHPAVVDGQVRGAVAQGIGAVLFEHAAYGPDGEFTAGTFLDYLVPTALDIPTIDIVHLHGPTDDPVPYRGVGEGGAIGAPAAVVSGVEDALADLGVRLTEQYLPPSVVRAQIEQQHP